MATTPAAAAMRLPIRFPRSRTWAMASIFLSTPGRLRSMAVIFRRHRMASSCSPREEQTPAMDSSSAMASLFIPLSWYACTSRERRGRSPGVDWARLWRIWRAAGRRPSSFWQPARVRPASRTSWLWAEKTSGLRQAISTICVTAWRSVGRDITTRL